jgi:N-methylhydantoinase A/oxoprolinase/acetone carboxylase beta subunit
MPSQCCAKKVEAIAICMLHSYANPAHERRARDLVKAHAAGNVSVHVSSAA